MIRMRYVAIFLCLLFLATGCRAKLGGVPSAKDLQQPITSPNAYLYLYKQWTGRLAGLAGEINNSYNNWNDQKISRQEFLNQLLVIQSKLDALKKEADYTDFKLNVTDQKQVNSEAVTRAYLVAEKGVNDFLYYAPHLTDQNIKEKYNELIVNKYNPSNQELQKLLAQIH